MLGTRTRGLWMVGAADPLSYGGHPISRYFVPIIYYARIHLIPNRGRALNFPSIYLRTYTTHLPMNEDFVSTFGAKFYLSDELLAIEMSANHQQQQQLELAR